MSAAVQLEELIEEAIEDLRRDYTKTLSSVAFLKEKVNDLELKTIKNDYARDDADRDKLSLAVKELDQFIDYIISQAAKTRQRCEKLKMECALQPHEPVRLKKLLSLCSENEQLAKDLLCYSLGRLNKEEDKSQNVSK